MKVPESININAFSYDLPENRIASHPLGKRDSSKLLYYRAGQTETHQFIDLPDILSNDCQLVFNDTKVIQARILFQKITGAEIEVFLLEPWYPSEYVSAFLETKETVWKCLIGNAKKWKSGILRKKVFYNNVDFILKAELSGDGEGCRLVSFKWDNPEVCFSKVILAAGLTPLPPYIKRDADINDKTRYQTVYSNFEGSVAAPTAGLHFTDDVFKKLKKKSIQNITLTLHVGAGTFVPVKETDALLHNMHTEHFFISENSLKEMLNSEKRIISVGTTSVRTMESLYWLGVKLMKEDGEDSQIHLDQWEAYGLRDDITREAAIKVILDYLRKKNLRQLKASTRIMIVPGYDFRMTDGIITNFHQPNSTLLLLIAAYLGDEWKKVYNYALNNDYRFLSYGDSSLLIR